MSHAPCMRRIALNLDGTLHKGALQSAETKLWIFVLFFKAT